MPHVSRPHLQQQQAVLVEQGVSDEADVRSQLPLMCLSATRLHVACSAPSTFDIADPQSSAIASTPHGIGQWHIVTESNDHQVRHRPILPCRWTLSHSLASGRLARRQRGRRSHSILDNLPDDGNDEYVQPLGIRSRSRSSHLITNEPG